MDKVISRGIASTSLWSSRHAKTVVALVLLMTVVLGYGVTKVTTNVDVADVLPRGNYNTQAAHNLTDHFRSTFTQQVTFQLHVDEKGDHWRHDNDALEYRDATLPIGSANGDTGGAPFQVQPDHLNITDEVYVRAMEELVAFIEDHTDHTFSRQVSINNIYALINWTVAGGEGVADESAFSLPPADTPDGEALYQLVDYTTKAAVLDTVDALASPSWNHAALLFMPESNNTEDMRVLGEKIIEARDAYVEAVDAGQTRYTVWGSDNKPLLTVDLPVANAHSSDLVEQDLLRLMPAIAAFIVVSLFVAFRNFRSIGISFVTLGVGVTWTYGAMGYMGIALNTLNMTIVPLIMGVGIDYAIHMINEFLEHKAHGRTDAEAFEEAGGRAGLAMFIATMTTVLGLIVMMFSPSLLMAQLGLLSAIAIGAIYLLTITFIPAALTIVGGTEKMGASFSPSKVMPATGRGVSKTRYLVLLLVIGATVITAMSAATLDEEAFGDPGNNFPADDPIRQEHEQGLSYFYEMDKPDVKANILTFEGDGIMTPDAIRYYRTIEANLKQESRVIDDTLRTLPFFIETWLTVKGGPACALGVVGLDQLAGTPLGGTAGTLETLLGPALSQAGQNGVPCADQAQFPQTEQEIRGEIEAMFASPMRELSSLIINHPTLNMAAMTFSVKAETFDEASMVWDQVWNAVGAANQTFGGHAPDGVKVAFVGNTATNYLFVEEELPWLWMMGYAATAILFVLVLVFTLDLKASLVATILAAITSIWWLGILPLIDVGLAVTLMLPLVFIFNIGTDYAVHIIWNLKKVGDAREVFETTGKAILFSAITTAGSFAIFAFIRNVAVQKTMIATTLAIVVIFLSTLLVIPVFYKIPKKGESGREKTPAPAMPARRGGPVSAAKRRKEPVSAHKRPKAE